MQISASGAWSDWTIGCGADGYRKWYLRPFEKFRRVPEALWFELVGCVSKDIAYGFRIDAAGRATMPASGRLYLFANDAPFMYWNNAGDVLVRINF